MISEREERRRALVAETLERVGPRPETRLVHLRAGRDDVEMTFGEFVLETVDHVCSLTDEMILDLWRRRPIADPGFESV